MEFKGRTSSGGTLARPNLPNHIPFGLFSQPVPEVRVGNFDQGLNPLPDIQSPQPGDTILRDHVVGVVSKQPPKFSYPHLLIDTSNKPYDY